MLRCWLRFFYGATLLLILAASFLNSNLSHASDEKDWERIGFNWEYQKKMSRDICLIGREQFAACVEAFNRVMNLDKEQAKELNCPSFDSNLLQLTNWTPENLKRIYKKNLQDVLFLKNDSPLSFTRRQKAKIHQCLNINLELFDALPPDNRETLIDVLFEIAEEVTEGIPHLGAKTHSKYFSVYLLDPYAQRWILKDDYWKSQEKINADEITGVGIKVFTIHGLHFIAGILPNGPAELAGLKVGDIILEVDKQKVHLVTRERWNIDFKGVVDTEAKLKILRENVELEITVTRRSYQPPKLSLRHMTVASKNIAIIQIPSFFEKELCQKFHDLFSDLPTDRLQGLILDLRDNNGGYADDLDCLVEFFTPKGELLYELIKISKNAEQQKATKVFSKIEQSINLPLRALINYGSASSGEKLAGILQALNIGRVIGQRSLSKGTSMNPVSVASFFDEDVSVMTYSSRHEYLLPGEVKVEGVGVTPDIVVPSPSTDRLPRLNDWFVQPLRYRGTPFFLYPESLELANESTSMSNTSQFNTSKNPFDQELLNQINLRNNDSELGWAIHDILAN